MTERPALMVRDFSDLVCRALAEYIERHHPGLIAVVEQELSATYEQKPLPMLQAVAEDREVQSMITRARAPGKKNAAPKDKSARLTSQKL